MLDKDFKINYNDITANIAEWIGRYHVFSNTAGTEMTTILQLFRENLDENRSGSPLFAQMDMEQYAYSSKYLHACRVLYLDFSDFSCKTCDEAKKYISQKMSQLYKEHLDLWEWDENDFYHYNSAEKCLDIIEQKADDTQLQHSLRKLLCQANHRNLMLPHTAYVALLINNMVLLESVAMEHQYYDWMESFLEEFIVEDVYKFCGTFLQIGDLVSKEPEFYEWGGYPHGYLSYYRFGITEQDIWQCKNRYPFIAADIWKQEAFVEHQTETDTTDWDLVIQEKRKIIAKQKEKERIHIEQQKLAEQRRYQMELPENFPKVSSFLGIRRLNNLSYSQEKLAYYNAFLRQIYAWNFHDTEQIYKLFQKVGKKITDVTDSANHYLQRYFEKEEDSVEKTKWKVWINEDTYWIYFGFSNGRYDFVPTPYMLKAYVSLQCETICEVFFQSLIYLKKHAQKKFGAKVSRINRADQMCYWISPTDLPLLYQYYASYYEILKCEMEFVAYRKRIGISRDFGNEISHNQMQAKLISTYFSILQSKEEINLLDMYQLFVGGWNGALNEEHPFTKAFKYTSAASFLVMLETLHTILQKDSQLPDDSLLLTEDPDLWESLYDAKCWGDLEKK